MADDLGGQRGVRDHLPAYFEVVFSDKGGNEERAACVYDTRRVRLGSKIGETALNESERRDVKVPGIKAAFVGLTGTPTSRPSRSSA